VRRKSSLHPHVHLSQRLLRMGGLSHPESVEHLCHKSVAHIRKAIEMFIAAGAKHEVDITFFDHMTFSNQLRAAPSAAGLSNLDEPCQPTYPEIRPACANPDACHYWDEWHPTRKIHAMVGEAMLSALTTHNQVAGAEQ